MKSLWNDLDPETREAIDEISEEQAIEVARSEFLLHLWDQTRWLPYADRVTKLHEDLLSPEIVKAMERPGYDSDEPRNSFQEYARERLFGSKEA